MLELRQNAEKQLGSRPATISNSLEKNLLLHELQVRQIELAMQNAQLREVEEELRQSLISYRDLYDLAPVGYLTLNSLGVIEKANLTSATLLGVEQAELLNHQFAKNIASSCIDEWHIFFMSMQREVVDMGRNIELTLCCGDERLIDVQLNCVRVISTAHKSTLRLTITDISARKQVEFELRTILEDAGDSIWITSAEGRYLNANPAACKLTGYNLDELKGMAIPDLIPMKSLSDHLTLLGSEKFIRREWQLKCKDTKIVTVELTTKRLPDGRYLAIGRDLSEKR